MIEVKASGDMASREQASNQMPSASTQPAPGALQGRVVLIVGAHGALGRAAALACGAAGAQVVLLGRKVPKLNRVYDAIARDGAEPLLYPLDMEGATPPDFAEMAERIGKTLGRLDGVLHCAADFAGLTPLEHTDPGVFARTLHVDLTARWWLTQACLPLLRAAPDAAVVFAIDDPQRTVQPYWGAYGIAQAGNAALVRMLDGELASTSVRVCGLAPGPIRSPLRAKAFVEDADVAAVDPAVHAPACVMLLSATGAAYRGQTFSPAA
jgi:NAD(P)-dependent dehydrogenase (short-subunit alcohol dehydrogenase family)